MVSVLDKKQIRPNPTLVSTLARIGELRNYLSTLEQNASKALGLDVEIISFDTQTYQATGSKFFRDSIKKLERLRVTAGPNVCVEAWKELEKHADWTFLCYESGDWENRCQPTLRLVQWIYEWGGLHEDKQPTLQIAVDGFKRRGELLLPLRNETSGRLCGKCGEEVKDLEEHISALHLGPDSALTLYLYMEEKVGENYVLFQPDVPQTYILRNPIPVAQYQRENGPFEVWSELEAPNAVRRLTINRSPNRQLRTTNPQQPHRHIRIECDTEEWVESAVSCLESWGPSILQGIGERNRQAA